MLARAGAAASLALLMASAGVSCGGDSSEAMRATLSDDECTYEGSKTPPSGMFTVEVENRTKNFGAFALAALSADHTIDDLEPHLKEARQQFEKDGTLPPLPTLYKQVVRVGVESGATSRLPADVPSGRYALMCFVDDLPTWRVYAAAQLDVTE